MMEVNDLALCFTGTDPKHQCYVYDNNDVLLYTGRIEFLIYAEHDELLKQIGNSFVNSLSIIEVSREGFEPGDLIIKINPLNSQTQMTSTKTLHDLAQCFSGKEQQCCVYGYPNTHHYKLYRGTINTLQTDKDFELIRNREIVYLDIVEYEDEDDDESFKPGTLIIAVQCN